ncbi:MAG: hypothetical protein J5J00_04370 [Deltaproteobacteria bacterium]|nr:hypothetical protein [Deltaproteobacteria bacterium]
MENATHKSTSFIVVMLVALAATVPASATPFYRETFSYCGSAHNPHRNAFEVADWRAVLPGIRRAKIGNLKVHPPGGPGNVTDINSNPRGSEDGAGFWAREVSGLTIYTEELSFDVSSLVQVEYHQRLSGISLEGVPDGSQLALLINGTWYFSDLVTRQVDRGFFEAVVLSPHELTYGTSPDTPGVGPVPPANSGVALPSAGPVSAFGVFVPVAHGRVRIDNFTLVDASTEERFTSNSTFAKECRQVENLPPAVLNASFCEGGDIRPAGKVKIAREFKKRILRSKFKTLTALRDKIIASLLLANNLRVDELVNLTVADYQNGLGQTITTAGASPRNVKLKKSVRKLVDTYLQASGYSTFSEYPLLQSIEKRSQRPSGQALCTKAISSVIKKQARKAGTKAKIRSK